jgi:nucleotide-binding universal stress UspA family protein
MTETAKDAMTLLLCYDGSDDARHAITRAAALFPEVDAVILHVSKSKVDWLFGPSLGPLLEIPGVDEAILANANKILDAGVEFAIEAGLVARGELRTTGNAVWRTVIDVAADLRPALIVAGSHGRRWRDVLPLGSVARGLLAHADVPVLITHRTDRAASPAPTARLLLGFDGSATSEVAVDAVAQLLSDAQVELLSAWERPGIVTEGLMGVQYAQDIEASLAAHADEVGQDGVQRARSAGLSATPVSVCATDGVGRALLDVAHERNADLICVGTHGRGAITRVVVGSTAQWIVQHADLPVLVIPADVDAPLVGGSTHET